MTHTIQVLLAEDDARLAALTRQYLESHQLVVTHVADGSAVPSTVRNTHFDVVLLDLMLPGLDGLEVCREIRRSCDVPIIIITARDEEADRVMGLEIGADDYVTKPFSPRELLARIKAVVRRYHGQVSAAQPSLVAGDLKLDPATAGAWLAGVALDLTSYEFAILHTLAKNAGRILNRDQLMERSGGDSAETFDRSIDVHISRLRKKLAVGSDAKRIKTVRGMGYMYLKVDP